MLCVRGLGLCFWTSVEVSCPGRRQSNHYFTAEAPPCCCEARPVAAGSCSSAVFSTMGYALQRNLSVVVGCLGNGSLCQQWAFVSVGAGCLGNCRLRQQWACVSIGGVASVMVDVRPPRSASGTVSTVRPFGIVVLSVPLRYPTRCVLTISWAGPLPKFPSVSSSALSSLRWPFQQGTRKSTPCGERWVGPAASFSRQSLCLVSRVSFILGNFPVLWATKISLKMQL